MRPHDKKKNMQRANLLAEQRHIQENSLVREVRDTIQYAGSVLTWDGKEYDDSYLDELQAMIDSYEREGKKAAVTHLGGKHYFYRELPIGEDMELERRKAFPRPATDAEQQAGADKWFQSHERPTSPAPAPKENPPAELDRERRRVHPAPKENPMNEVWGDINAEMLNDLGNLESGLKPTGSSGKLGTYRGWEVYNSHGHMGNFVAVSPHYDGAPDSTVSHHYAEADTIEELKAEVIDLMINNHEQFPTFQQMLDDGTITMDVHVEPYVDDNAGEMMNMSEVQAYVPEPRPFPERLQFTVVDLRDEIIQELNKISSAVYDNNRHEYEDLLNELDLVRENINSLLSEVENFVELNDRRKYY